MEKQSLIALIALATISMPAAAKNTNDDWKWKNTYYQSYGEWTTACEDRSDDETVKRCYLRYVDAYAREPFGAFFVFVTVSKSGPVFSFEFERGTRFNGNWNVSAKGRETWTFNPANCPFFGECILAGEEGIQLAKSLAAPGATMNFKFTDREQRELDRDWPGDTQFADAFYDLQKQTAARQID